MSYCSLSQQPATRAVVRPLLMVFRYNHRRDRIRTDPQDQPDPEQALLA